jgi:DNA-directed RNA polymerase subunit RPC12/RpoP
VIIYELDTSRFRNGNTTISVLAYDLIGNQQLVSTYVTIQNEGGDLTWIYIIAAVAVVLIAVVLIFYIRYYKPTQRKRELAKEMLSEDDKQKLLEEQKARELEEMRIREEAEMATPETEALKPFKYKCTRCSKEFENKEYIWSLECPECKTDTLVLEYQCKICGKYYYYDLPGEYYCKDCDIKLLK